MTQNIFDKKDQLLEVFLDYAIFSGLSEVALLRAGSQLGLNAGEVAILAPDGPISMIDFWFSKADDFMIATLKSRDGLKIREKATLAVWSRIEFFAPKKEALRKAIALMAMPNNAPRALAIGARFVDKAWRTFGDKSTDFNFYTKRMMLLGVDIATSAYFLGDETDDYQDTWDFLDRRIENIMQIEKTKFQIKKSIAKIPDPIPFLAKLRFGAKPLP